MLDRFVAGAAAFLIGHIAYLVAFLQVPLKAGWLFAGAVILGLLLSLVARPVLAGALSRSRLLGGIVAAYLVALGAVLVLESVRQPVGGGRRDPCSRCPTHCWHWAASPTAPRAGA